MNINRKLKIFTVAAVSAAMTMGTVPAAQLPVYAKSEKTMGRYLENDVILPEDAATLNSMVKLENGDLRICYYGTDGQMYADSNDKGKKVHSTFTPGMLTKAAITEDDNKASEITSIYEKARYSDEAVTKEEYEKFKRITN